RQPAPHAGRKRPAARRAARRPARRRRAAAAHGEVAGKRPGIEGLTEKPHMPYKIVAGIISAALLIAYIAPVLLRLKREYALWVVSILGIAMMIVDLWQSLRREE